MLSIYAQTFLNASRFTPNTRPDPATAALLANAQKTSNDSWRRRVRAALAK